MTNYKYRVITGRGDCFCEVLLKIEGSKTEYIFNYEAVLERGLDELALKCIQEGIAEAFEVLDKDMDGYAVSLIEAKDLTGESFPLGFGKCASGAIYKHFNRLDLAPVSCPIDL